jgi:protoporphyrinogen oxidase
MIEERQDSIAVIGAGVTGLVAAYRLLQRGYDVRIFEAGPQPGGLLRTFEVGGERLECFYHHLFTSDGAAIRLFDELGVLKTITWRTTRMGIFYNDHVYPFTSPWDLLRFRPLLGIRDRIRLGIVALQLRRNQYGAGFDEISALEWMRRHSGGRAANIVWEPLLRGKFGDMADQVSMAWLWNRLRLRFSSRSLLSRREVLGYQRGSFGVWIDAIARLIGVLGGTIQMNERIVSVVRNDGALEVETESRRKQRFDAVVATVSNQAFLSMAPSLGEDYAANLRQLTYQDALCLVLSLDRPLSEFYWLNVNDRSVPFLAVIEHTKLAEPESYGGRYIVYVSNYLPRDAPLLGLDADALFEHYLPHLKRINPAFDEAWVSSRWRFHAANAQPVFTVGAGSRIAEHRTPVPGLYLSNMAQIYPQDRGQNNAIVLGETVAAMVAADLEAASRSPEQA